MLCISKNFIFYYISCLFLACNLFISYQKDKEHGICGKPGLNPWVRKIPWRRESLPMQVFWPGEFYTVQGVTESQT